MAKKTKKKKAAPKKRKAVRKTKGKKKSKGTKGKKKTLKKKVSKKKSAPKKGKKKTVKKKVAKKKVSKKKATPKKAKKKVAKKPARRGGADIIMLDFGCTVNHYCSDMTRTYFWGKPNTRQKKIYLRVLEAQNRAFRKLKSGEHRAKFIDKAARGFLSKKFNNNFISWNR